MNNTLQKYPKRLIEIDLPIRKISEHARREKSIRHGHISTLHLWWARRPLAACRAVALAALLPDPADAACPESFLEAASATLSTLREAIGGSKAEMREPLQLRVALLQFISAFANWDLSNDRNYLNAARALVAAAHQALGGAPGSRPFVFDPFAGGGAIPLEALRVGAESFASDLNPVPVLLNRVMLEFIPRFGATLARDVREWGLEIQKKASTELGSLYAKNVAAYLFARTIRCEGPECGITVPLFRSSVLAKRRARNVFIEKMQAVPGTGTVSFVVKEGRGSEAGTVRRGSVVCPACGYTTPVSAVRKQLGTRDGGTKDAQLLAVVEMQRGGQGRRYRVPEPNDERQLLEAKRRLAAFLAETREQPLSAVPGEPIPHDEPRRINVHQYGIRRWADLFTDRQALSLAQAVRLIQNLSTQFPVERSAAIATCLSLALGRLVDANSAQATWSSSGEFVRTTFGRQALPFVWDFAEANPWGDSGGNWMGAIEWVAKVIEDLSRAGMREGHVESASATKHPLPDDAADMLLTDPPYYYSVPYSHLSDFFYVWHKRVLTGVYPELFAGELTPKAEECVQSLPHSEVAHLQKDRAFYENAMRQALAEARRVTKPGGVGIVVFAHTDTEAWEALLGALLDAGWSVTASWPIDTERATRTLALRQRTLASSIHLVCRPREASDGSLATDTVGDWREVLRELPQRIHEWLPRLAEEGIVGADAIFACLGPALEVFSRYARVEKVSGEVVPLREYLEHVWAAVSREALSMLFDAAETTGLEEDARLTAMWLWTLATPEASSTDADVATDADEDDDEAALEKTGASPTSGFGLDYDAARKIAQGLGARIDELAHVVEVKGHKARLLAVHERAKHLFDKTESGPIAAKKAVKKKQITLFGEIEEPVETQGWSEVGAPRAGTTTLDRVHQAMLLFGSGRGEALKRFIVEEGVGRQPQFWKLAQSLSALYPGGTDEKRWVDGVLARKKGLGF